MTLSNCAKYLTVASTVMVPVGQLPVTPQLTGGLGLAGVVLMIAGFAYAFYSIRKPKVAVFFSTAFLTVIAYTCMAVFLYEPPSTQGGQAGIAIGGILVAAIFGAGGMKCLIGWGKHAVCYMLAGFCICMWLLTIKTGGLFGPGSNDGRLSTNKLNAVGYSLSLFVSFVVSFLPVVRPYLDIGCIGFSASTMIVLGADCFTRAGYKEFWIWVWGVGPHWFPDQDFFTYSVTRPIQAEQGTIAALTLFSLVWQFELWKPKEERQYVQEREKVLREIAEARTREERDLEAGRQTLETFEQEQRIFNMPKVFRHKFWDAYMRRPSSRRRILDLEEANGDNAASEAHSDQIPPLETSLENHVAPNEGDILSVSHMAPSATATTHHRGLSRKQIGDAAVEPKAPNGLDYSHEFVDAVETAEAEFAGTGEPAEQAEEQSAAENRRDVRSADAKRLSSWRTKEWTQQLSKAVLLPPEPLYAPQNADPDKPAPLDVIDLLRTSASGGVITIRNTESANPTQARLVKLGKRDVDPWAPARRRASTSALIQENRHIWNEAIDRHETALGNQQNRPPDDHERHLSYNLRAQAFLKKLKEQRRHSANTIGLNNDRGQQAAVSQYRPCRGGNFQEGMSYNQKAQEYLKMQNEQTRPAASNREPNSQKQKRRLPTRYRQRRPSLPVRPPVPVNIPETSSVSSWNFRLMQDEVRHNLNGASRVLMQEILDQER